MLKTVELQCSHQKKKKKGKEKEEKKKKGGKRMVKIQSYIKLNRKIKSSWRHSEFNVQKKKKKKKEKRKKKKKSKWGNGCYLTGWGKSFHNMCTY